MKSRTKVAAAAGVVLAFIVLPSSPAFADQGAAVIGNQAYYVTSTDSLSAWDTQADGKSAISELRASVGSTVKRVTNSGGQGTTAYGTFAMPASYQIRACVQDIGGGGAKTCGSWVNGS